MQRFRKATAAAAAALAATSGVIFIDRASAGGGCHRDSLGQTQGRGTTVEMRENCFGPTVLRVDPGAEVTFVNRDATMHRVDGVGWGGEAQLAEGQFLTQRFSSPGVYPFTCLLHLRMSGAIVVGDGQGMGPVIEVAAGQQATSAAPAGQPVATRTDNGQTLGLTTTSVMLAAVGLGAFSVGRARERRRVHRHAAGVP